MKAPTAEQVTQKRERAERLRELTEHPTWQELAQVMEERKTVHYRRLTDSLIRGEATYNQRLIDRMAGYFDAIEDMLRRPDIAESAFASALARYERAELAKEGESE